VNEEALAHWGGCRAKNKQTHSVIIAVVSYVLYIGRGTETNDNQIPLNTDLNVFDMIHLLTAIGLSPGGSSTVHIYTQTIHRTIQNKQYIEQHNNWRSAGRAPSWLVIPWHLPYNRVRVTTAKFCVFKSVAVYLKCKPTAMGEHSSQIWP
jgi:hypothetical protein